MGKKRLIKFLNEFELYLGTVLFISMTILLTLQVITRYVFKNSFSWTEELCTIFFIWMAYLGASSAVLKGKHLRIDLFLNMFQGRMRKAVLLFTNLVTMFFCGYIILPLLNIIRNFTRTGSSTILLRIPKDLIYWMLPFCLGLMIVRLVQDSVRIVRSTGDDVEIDSNTSIFGENEEVPDLTGEHLPGNEETGEEDA